MEIVARNVRENKDKMGEMKKRFEMAMEKLGKMKLEDFRIGGSPEASPTRSEPAGERQGPSRFGKRSGAARHSPDEQAGELDLQRASTSGARRRTDLGMSKIPSLFAKLRTEAATRHPDHILDSPKAKIEGDRSKLTGEAIKGLLAQKLSRKVMQRMQSEKL